MQCANSNSAWECQVDRNLKHLTIVEAEFDLRPKLYQSGPGQAISTLLWLCSHAKKWIDGLGNVIKTPLVDFDRCYHYITNCARL